MQKNYFKSLCLLALCFLMGQVALAQRGWQAHVQQNKAVTTLDETTEVPGSLYIGHASPSDEIWPYDGLSLDRDSRIGVAVKLPREKFEDYIGMPLAELLIGWDSEEVPGKVNAFVRTSFDGENLATATADVEFGWNTVALDKALTLPDCDTLVIGYYVDIKKDVCSIPKFYPQNVPYSAYLWDETSVVDGKEVWYDACSQGMLAIIGVVKDTEGKFKNRIEVMSSSFDGIGLLDDYSNALLRLKNVGTNDITSVEVSAKFGDKTWSQEVPFTAALPSTRDSRVSLPFKALGSGFNKYWISKVNGVDVEQVDTMFHQVIAIPEATADKYQAHHLMEYWTTENSFYYVNYYENYVKFFMKDFTDRVTLINQHCDDQFMLTSEKYEDDAMVMMLDFVNGDSAQVYLPSMSFNRSCGLAIDRISFAKGPLFSTPFPEFGAMLMEEMVLTPTFAAVNAKTEWEPDYTTLKINVSGDVAEGVMPDGEPLFLTVYLMEYDVVSDSQKFWDENESFQYGGKYTHCNIIRQNLTPLYGLQLEKTGGEYSMDFTTEIPEEWNSNKLGVVAFLNRGEQNDYQNRQIINSCEHKIVSPTGIDDVTVGNELEGAELTDIYNAAGMRVSKPMDKGVYLMKYTKNGKQTIKKVLVK